jgi:hypothetical protein
MVGVVAISSRVTNPVAARSSSGFLGDGTAFREFCFERIAKEIGRDNACFGLRLAAAAIARSSSPR